MGQKQQLELIRNANVADVMSANPPFLPVSPIFKNRSEWRAVVRRIEDIQLHRGMKEFDWMGATDEFDEAARLKNQSVPDPILITTSGTILAGFGSWRLAVSEGKREIQCLECLLTEDEGLQLILRHYQKRCGWNEFVRICLALTLKDGFQKTALENMRSGGKHKGWANLPKAQHIEVRQKIATVAGVCPRYVSAVETILKVAHPALIFALRNGTLTIGRAIQFCKSAKAEQFDQFIRYSEERATNKVIRQCIPRPREKNSLNVVAVLDSLQRQEAQQPGSVAVRLGRHKRTVILIGQDQFEMYSQRGSKST
jgi:hypothetical protein